MLGAWRWLRAEDPPNIPPKSWTLKAPTTKSLSQVVGTRPNRNLLIVVKCQRQQLKTSIVGNKDLSEQGKSTRQLSTENPAA